ncbi:hypothetical protein AB0280_00820 [Pseudarthrobacter sp902506025]|uniref:Ig-like domain-containing protein n=1 Tax=Pseudarthrobacter defluvii TaxID=410837 RepID=A0ABT9UGN2_9MICC|nr:hypothetical protein [Pseudarthrobacter defluvii]MDQ0118407.1 hypothetical protein [Pseudarthrobacter defluvii]
MNLRNQGRQVVEPALRSQGGRRRLSRAAGVLAAAVVISWAGPAANAFWQTLGSNAGVVKADSIPAMAAPAASVSASSASVDWKQGTTAAGVPVAGYAVARYSTATGGIAVAATGGCAGTVTALACSEALPPGTWYYTVTPMLGAWAGAESPRSAGVTAADTTPPAAPNITAPARITSAPATGTSANVASVPVTITAEAGSSVTVTATDTPPPGTTAQTVSQVFTATGSSQTINFNLSTLRDGTITYSAVATDAAGNTSAAGTATSAKDATAPAISAVTLVNGGAGNVIDQGDKVVLKFSEALDASTICSNWTIGGNQSINGSEQVTVRVSAADILTVTLDGAQCPTARIGSVSLGGAYSGGTALSFHGTGSGASKASSLAWDATKFELTITLGSRDTPGTAANVNGNVKPTYTPSAGLTDTVGNPLPSTPFTAAPSRF